MIFYDFTKQAKKQLDNFPLQIRKRIVKKIKEYCSRPEPLREAKYLANVPGKVYRYRIGDYRVIFDWEGRSILITQIEHRGSAYKRLLR
ncbi:MAG: type II toxin-antitoxin system RelE/ParE family toxin [Candidatus Jacksonbacteria bacterium]